MKTGKKFVRGLIVGMQILPVFEPDWSVYMKLICMASSMWNIGPVYRIIKETIFVLFGGKLNTECS